MEPDASERIEQAIREDGRYPPEAYGRKARDVLARWNIRATRDFGEMIYVLINLGVMGKQDSDRREDFHEVYDFDQAFNSYQISFDALDE